MRCTAFLCCLVVAAAVRPATFIGSVHATEPPTEEATDKLPVLPQAPVMAAGKHAQGVAARIERRRPEQDDWQTEQFSADISQQLKYLATMMAQRNWREHDLAKVLSDRLQPGRLRPEPFSSAFQDESLQVNRCDSDAVESESASDNRDVATGIAGGITRLKELVAGFPTQADQSLHFKFKVAKIQQSADGIQTLVYYLGWNDQGPVIQQNAIWHCQWTLPSAEEGEAPKLVSVQVEGYEEIHGGAEPLFQDVTLSAIGDQSAFRDHLALGTGYWMRRLQATLGLDTLGHCGIAIGDVNGDGRDDLFACQPGGLPNRLFIQNPDGTATDQAAAAGVNFLDRTISALLIDIDNDGDQDLAMLTPLELLLLENDGKGHFTSPQESQIPATNIFSISAADFDNDGDLDLYVCGYSFPTGKAQVPTPYHDANNGYRNRLLRNDTDWKFTDVTASVGLDVHNLRYSFASAWEDFDNDGDQDLYVSNDFGRNNLYRNDNGKFVDVAAAAGVEDLSAGMSVSWGDFNRDGWPDLYVSNMFSSAGNRVTYQRRFREDLDADTRAVFQRHARGNSLFQNMGDGTFRDVSGEAQVSMGRWAWGSQWVDVNNDGWDDIVVTNGNLTGPDTDDL